MLMPIQAWLLNAGMRGLCNSIAPSSLSTLDWFSEIPLNIQYGSEFCELSRVIVDACANIGLTPIVLHEYVSRSQNHCFRARGSDCKMSMKSAAFQCEYHLNLHFDHISFRELVAFLTARMIPSTFSRSDQVSIRTRAASLRLFRAALSGRIFLRIPANSSTFAQGKINPVLPGLTSSNRPRISSLITSGHPQTIASHTTVGQASDCEGKTITSADL